jgi:hypothetical protein
MSEFSIRARSRGIERSVAAIADGAGFTVHLDGEPQVARNTAAALRMARDFIGALLHEADRTGSSWGMIVTVSEGSAVYGDWRLSGIGGGAPGAPDLLARIRSRYSGGPAMAALENALQIVNGHVADKKAA